MAETPPDIVNLTIDGMAVAVPKGTLVIEAARRVGVMIPHFCYHPKLAPDANCRMCLVEVEKVPRLQTSCSTPVAEGMVVRTATTVVTDAHKSVLEFILANHPLDCPVCDQGGRCDLQDFSHQYTPTTSRFAETKRVFPKEYFSPLIETQMNRCVQCLRCVRYCDEVMDVKALAPAGRGTMTEIKHFAQHELDCEFCGGCIQICPVGAITSRLSMYQYRPWMLKRADTICTYCGDGCQITIQTKGNELIEVNSAHEAGRNNGDLCAKGYFGYHVTTHPERLTHPLIRKGGDLTEATWEEALEYIEEHALRLRSNHGAESFAGLISGRCTNEELYLFQKFMRLGIGTNHIDSSARYGHINGTQALKRIQGTHRWTISFEDIVKAEGLLLVGTNVTETNPITGLKVKEAVKKGGAKLVTIETLEPAVGNLSNIANLSSYHFSSRPTQYNTVVLGLMKAVVEEHLIASSVSQEAPEFVRGISDRLNELSWSDIEGQTKKPSTTFKETAQALCRTNKLVILVGQGVLRTEGGEDVTALLLELLLLTGHHGQAGSGVAPLAEENNDQGAVEMGAVAEYLPGTLAYSDPSAQARMNTAWNASLPSHQGLSLMGILQQAQAGSVKSMFIVGENPVGTLPPTSKVKETLKGLDLLVCQELFLTETAQLAHVVLPACSYAEKEGTFTNTEGHVQNIRPAIEPIGESRPDWEILAVLSTIMGYDMAYEDAKEIFKEIRGLIPGYGLIGPAPTPPRPDVTVVKTYLQTGWSAHVDERYQLRPERAEQKGTLPLFFQQSLFHSGKFSVRAKGLLRLQHEGLLSLHPETGEQLGVADGASIHLTNEQGTTQVSVKFSTRTPKGMASFPEHFDQSVGALCTLSIDPRNAVPCFKTTTVTANGGQPS